MATLRETEAAQAKAEAALRGNPDISAVGITRDADGFALRISLEREDADLGDLLKDVGDVPVKIRHGGRITALRS
jgi:hypothetical protein